MYHIKDDLRSRKSAQAIYESIRHILKIKDIHTITITDIKNESGISRSSFYRNFDNIIDPLTWKLDFFIKEYLKESKNHTDHILFFYEYWDKHSEFITTLAKSGFEFLIYDAFRNNLNDVNEYSLVTKVAVMSSILSHWIKRNKKESIEEMKKITLSLLKDGVII